MEMLEAALALLCALGVGSLLWLLFGLLVRPARGREPWVVLPGRGPGEDLEAGLRQLAWLRRAGLFRGEAVIWDEALDREGRQLALRLPCGGRGSSAVRRGNWRSGCGRRSGRRTESPNKQGDPFEPPVLL